MRKAHDAPPSSRRFSATTAPNLTDEQKDKAVAALLADVLNSIDRAVARAAKTEPGFVSTPTDASASLRRNDIANS
jgi:hypothetical protein